MRFDLLEPLILHDILDLIFASGDCEGLIFLIFLIFGVFFRVGTSTVCMCERVAPSDRGGVARIDGYLLLLYLLYAL